LILVDANIWIDHLRGHDAHLIALFNHRLGSLHPFTIGEIALGRFAGREAFLDWLSLLKSAPIATPQEVARLIDVHDLAGTGVGYVDAHLLASARLVSNGKLWTRDRRLAAQAERMGVCYVPAIAS
jgi:predicted nucleic acid-binding protein